MCWIHGSDFWVLDFRPPGISGFPPHTCPWFRHIYEQNKSQTDGAKNDALAWLTKQSRRNWAILFRHFPYLNSTVHDRRAGTSRFPWACRSGCCHHPQLWFHFRTMPSSWCMLTLVAHSSDPLGILSYANRVCLGIDKIIFLFLGSPLLRIGQCRCSTPQLPWFNLGHWRILPVPEFPGPAVASSRAAPPQHNLSILPLLVQGWEHFPGDLLHAISTSECLSGK